MRFLRLSVVALALTTPSVASAGPIERRIYPAPSVPLSLAGLPRDARLIDVTTRDGLKLKGVAIAPNPAMPTVLVFHGNGSSAADAVRWIAPALPAGFGLVAAEYRGYSANPGKPDEAGLAADADAFTEYATDVASGAPLWVLGHSLGAGVTLGLAQRRKFVAVITVGAFTRLRDAAPRIARAFVPDGYNNIAALSRLTAPYFLVHGTADPVIPVTQGEALHRTAGLAHLQGASLVVMGAEHAPSSEKMSAVLRVVRSYLASGELSAAGLPADIKLVPFGKTGPLNP
jgi:pimeloyl-ACP methyl ester carboxylesterase